MELVNFPLVSQLTHVEPIDDVNYNGAYDCVAASILACVMWYLGIKQVTPEYSPEALKDAAYSPYYTGATAASYYIPWCAKHGTKLSMVECGTFENAIQSAHKLLAENIPVIFTQQDDYAPLQFRNSYTHVCVFYADTANSLTCLDPYIDQPLTYSDDVWSTRLRSSQLWTLEKIATPQPKEEEIIVIGLDNATVAGYFEASGDMWKCKQTGKVIGNAILSWYRLYGNSALNGLTYLGLPLTSEIGIQSVPGATYQRFERGVVVYDEAHKIDKVPGAGAVYLAHIYDGVGIDPRITDLKNQITALNKKVNVQPDVQLQAKLAQREATLNQIEELAKIQEAA